MECTQRLQCTQELNSTQSERVYPEQIGFLGICGKKYPVKKGPNKIGRDPATCNIVLNLNSVSRQHAVINILNNENFMLMDLDSANKTKLLGKSLQPYIPQPLHNGDMVQFGEIFGIFRLLEEEADLPMTQAIDIPDTPVPMKHVSRINAITTIPESPDVSDKDDSFIVPSQPKCSQFQTLKTRNFIKPGKTISIQPMGTSKIDNIYWNSSKKSTSLNLDDSNTSLNDSIPPVKLVETENKISNDIHELETQMFPVSKLEEDTDSIYAVHTQLPKIDSLTLVNSVKTQIPSNSRDDLGIHSLETQIPSGSSPSMHSLNTQLPSAVGSSSVHSLETQMPGDNLPEICKISEQHDMQIDLCAQERDCSIYNAEKQVFPAGKENVPVNSLNKNDSPSSIQLDKLSTSNDDVLFDEVDQPFEVFESQAILTEDIELPINRLAESEFEPMSQIIKPNSAKRNMRINSNEPDSEPATQLMKPKSAKRNMRIKSDGSTDCEDDDILPTQKVSEKKVCDDDTTDCEEDMIELKTDITNKDVLPTEEFEDMATQVIINSEAPSAINNENDFEDIPTQVIVDNEAPSAVKNDIDFEDMPTQVLDVLEIKQTTEKGIISNLDFEDLPTQVLDEDVSYKKHVLLNKQLTIKQENSPFKVPSNSALKAKKKEGSRTPKIKPIPLIFKDKYNNYYQDTQDIYDDLYTQRIDAVEKKSVNKVSIDKEKSNSNKLALDMSVTIVDPEDNIEDYVKSMTDQKVLEVIGVCNQVAPIMKVPSDESNASDVENTPKKQRPFKFMDTDLPDSQEIKTTVSLSTRAVVTESSSDSETENNSEDQCTPVVFRKKKKPKPDVKLDLTKKFDLDALPTRVITRVRKPTTKLQSEQQLKPTEMLKPKFIVEQESEIDKDIITENISRLKSKIDKNKNNQKEKEKRKDTKGNQSNKESTEPKVVETSKAKSDKKVRACGQKADKNALGKYEKIIEVAKDSIDDATCNERRKRELKLIKTELLGSKNQSLISDKCNNQFISPVESKDKTHANKSKVETRDLSISPIDTTRSKRTRNAKTEIPKEKSPPEKESQTEKPKRKNARKATKSEPKKDKKKDPSPDKEIRRSKRQKPVKKEVKKETPKSILKKSVTTLSEESVVYNLSSRSNSDSCRNKRSSENDSEAPNAKRTRSAATTAIPSTTTLARTIHTHRVLFTAFPVGTVKGKLENMGAVVVTDVMQCTILLTQQIKRTFKLLCAVGLGKPIVGPDWVQACTHNNTIVDPWQYLIKDEVAEKRFHFSLERTLMGKRNFLEGYNVSSTPGVMPDAHEMKMIVECSGGAWREGGPQWVCVSAPEDSALWPALRRRGATVVSTEFILGGVLRQRVDIQLNRFK